MATKAQVMGGLTILAKYASDASIIMEADDFAELERLGWFVDGDTWSRFV